MTVGAHPHQPVWLNLGATCGIGLHGPGATNAARPLIATLFHDSPATTCRAACDAVATLYRWPPPTTANG